MFSRSFGKKPNRNNTTKKKRIIWTIAVILIILVAFFSYFTYVVINEKNAVDNLDYDVTSVTLTSISLNIFSLDITGSINVSISFSNPTDYTTPTIFSDFKWYISPTTSLDDATYCGTGNLTSVKIPANSSINSTIPLTFSLKSISLSLFSDIRTQQFYVIIAGDGNAKIFFDLIPVSKSFVEAEPINTSI